MQFSVILFTSHSELRIIENNSHDHLRRSSVVGRINTMKDQNLSNITDEDLAKAGLTRKIETREFITCHLTEATHYFNPVTETYHRRKCTSVHVGHGRNISTELAREIGWKPVMIVQPKEQMPKHREMILLASGNGSSVVVRRFDEFEKYDVQQFQIGNIYPDTPEGMKAARKKAGLDQ